MSTGPSRSVGATGSSGAGDEPATPECAPALAGALRDGLAVNTILAGLTTQRIGRYLVYYHCTDSTNTRAVRLAREGAPDGALVLANYQSQGRGRLDRQWYAPPGTSLLMSLLFRPNLAPEQAQRMTMICSLAAVDAIDLVSRLKAEIKWPNDLMLHGKKMGGVLTELGGRGDALDYVVVGMGINVNLDVVALPAVMTPSTSLRAEAGQAISRLSLLLTILERVEGYYQRMSSGWAPVERWREHLGTLGRRVTVGAGSEVIEGTAEDVDADGALIVRTMGGERCRVVAGDVTLRGHPTGDEQRHPRTDFWTR